MSQVPLILAAENADHLRAVIADRMRNCAQALIDKKIFGLQETTRIEQCLNIALKYQPDDPHILCLCADALCQLGNLQPKQRTSFFNLAVNYLSQAVAIEKTHFMANKLLASIHHELDNKELACEHAKEALNTKEDPECLLILANWQANQGQPQQALDLLNRGLTIDPNNSEMQLHKSVALLNMQPPQIEAAYLAVSQALKSQTKNRLALKVAKVIFTHYKKQLKSGKEAKAKLAAILQASHQ